MRVSRVVEEPEKEVWRRVWPAASRRVTEQGAWVGVARVRVTVNGKAVTYQAYGGDCTIDISSMLQVEFDNLQLGGALQPGMNELGKSVAKGNGL